MGDICLGADEKRLSNAPLYNSIFTLSVQCSWNLRRRHYVRVARKGGLANALTGPVSSVQMQRQMPGTTIPDLENCSTILTSGKSGEPNFQQLSSGLLKRMQGMCVCTVVVWYSVRNERLLGMFLKIGMV